MMELTEFAKILAVLENCYPRFNLEPRTIEAYYAILSDLDARLLKAAALHIAATSKWFPTASELRGAAFELLERQAGMPTAWDAWAEVCKKVGEEGHVRIPEFSHPLIQDTVKAVGGWLALCMSDNAVADRARFVQAYGSFIARERCETRLLPAIQELVAQFRKPETLSLD